MRVAVAYFHDDAFVQMRLTGYTSPEDVYYALDTLSSVGGKTNTAKGLEVARNQIFNNRGEEYFAEVLLVLELFVADVKFPLPWKARVSTLFLRQWWS